MKLLLDTHALIWSVDASSTSRLSARARTAIEDRSNDVFVSAASAWEIATKHRLGRLPQVSRLVAAWNPIIGELGAVTLELSAEHALRAGGYAVAHGDPFDRMLAAQAELDHLQLVTADPALAAFDIDTLW